MPHGAALLLPCLHQAASGLPILQLRQTPALTRKELQRHSTFAL